MHNLCVFDLFTFLNHFKQQLFSDCCDKFDYPGSIAYLSFCVKKYSLGYLLCLKILETCLKWCSQITLYTSLILFWNVLEPLEKPTISKASSTQPTTITLYWSVVSISVDAYGCKLILGVNVICPYEFIATKGKI